MVADGCAECDPLSLSRSSQISRRGAGKKCGGSANREGRGARKTTAARKQAGLGLCRTPPHYDPLPLSRVLMLRTNSRYMHIYMHIYDRAAQAHHQVPHDNDGDGATYPSDHLAGARSGLRGVRIPAGTHANRVARTHKTPKKWGISMRDGEPKTRASETER